MAGFFPLYSGSTGNCTYIGSRGKGILIDAGASAKGILELLGEKQISPDSIVAIFITHEHADHIKGLGALLKKIKAPVAASAKTLAAVAEHCKLPADTVLFEMNDAAIDFSGFNIKHFCTSHDCEGSGGYAVITPDDKKISVCTDLGVVTDSVRKTLLGSDLVMLESNHDIKMLKNGPYPPQLKLRIMSDLGHLSNNACAAELPALMNSGTIRFVLGHLSMHNNLPALAKAAAKGALADLCAKEGVDYILEVAKPQNANGDIIYL